MLKAQVQVLGKRYADVHSKDAVEEKYVEEVSFCNVFMVDD